MPRKKKVKVVDVPYLTPVQETICKLILYFQQKYGRANLYYNNGNQDSLCNLLSKKYGNGDWLQDIKLLSATRILREELGGVYYFNNRLCACGMASQIRFKPKTLRGQGLSERQQFQLAMGETVTLEEVIEKRKVLAKFGKRKKLLSARTAAKVANQTDNRVYRIEMIDLRIQDLHLQKQVIRSTW